VVVETDVGRFDVLCTSVIRLGTAPFWVAFVSDGYLPFRGDVEHASRHGSTASPSPAVPSAPPMSSRLVGDLGITLDHTGFRLFHH